MERFVDIHTHKKSSLNHISIQSRFIENVKVSDKMNNHFSTGIHPWSINKINVKEQLRVLAFVARDPKVCAIGECGIDRAIPINVERQIDIFDAHISIANNVNKPLIIHNVKAFSDFLFLIKKKPITTPWIFHGFTGNLRIAKELIKHGAYLSFGHHLLLDSSKAADIFKEIPLQNIFLETDNWQGEISEIYSKAVAIKSISQIELRNQIYQNYQTVFQIK